MGTVSDVLNAPHLVSEETRSRVREAIEAFDYRPNRAARSLQAKKTYLLGCRLANPLSPALDIFLHQLVRTATEHGFGFHRSMAAAGLQVDPDLIFCGENDFAQGRASTESLLDLSEPPTAVVTVQAELALGGDKRRCWPARSG